MNKKMHIEFLKGLVKELQKEDGGKDIYLDEEQPAIVWNNKK